MNDYPGDRLQKKLARAYVHTGAREAWARSMRPGGIAICLAGPDAADLPWLIMNRFAPGNILVVDRVPEGVRLAAETFPGIQTHEGELADALRPLPRGTVGYAVLDFTGRPETHREEFLAVGYRLRMFGIVAFTYLRGRDGKEVLDRAAAHVPPRVLGNAAIDQRRAAYSAQVIRWLADGFAARRVQGAQEFAPLGWVRYQSKTQPMEVALIQRRPTGSRIASWVRVVEKGEDEVRDLALSLRHDGSTADVIAGLLNLEISTVRAWFAHDTRGTYPSSGWS